MTPSPQSSAGVSGNAASARPPFLPLRWRRILALPFDRSMRRARRMFRAFPDVPFRSVMDVGAHHGEFTDLALRYYEPDKVWMVEADPELAQRLQARYASRPECKVVHTAVARSAGEVDFHVLHHRASSSLLNVSQRSSQAFGVDLSESRVVKVPAQSLDELFERERIERLDLMKVDIQGAERMLIEGGQTALRKVGWIHIEVFFDEYYEGAARFGEIDDRLWKLGFRLYRFASFRRATQGHVAYADAIYTNASLAS